MQKKFSFSTQNSSLKVRFHYDENTAFSHQYWPFYLKRNFFQVHKTSQPNPKTPRFRCSVNEPLVSNTIFSEILNGQDLNRDSVATYASALPLCRKQWPSSKCLGTLNIKGRQLRHRNLHLISPKSYLSHALICHIAILQLSPFDGPFYRNLGPIL